MSDQGIAHKTISDKTSSVLAQFGSTICEYARREKHSGVCLLSVSYPSLWHIVINVNAHHCSSSHGSAQAQQS